MSDRAELDRFKKPRHAWFSRKRTRWGGYCIYLTEDGVEVKVTEKSWLPRPSGAWDDAVYVGIVVAYVDSNYDDIE